MTCGSKRWEEEEEKDDEKGGGGERQGEGGGHSTVEDKMYIPPIYVNTD